MDSKLINKIYQLLTQNERMMPSQINKELSHIASRREVSQTIKQLVCLDRLVCTNELGTTFVRLSSNNALKVSDRIVVIPANKSFEDSQSIVIKLSSGNAFGNGQHPTTCLSLQLLDTLLCNIQTDSIQAALDIGTGTGILAIAAAKLGIKTVLATDRDPVAVFEARTNSAINQLKSQITVIQSERFPDDSFHLIMANLRLPTLISLIKKIQYHIATPGYLVCSGYTSDEMNVLLPEFENKKFHCLKHQILGRWAGGIFSQ